ncbi:hypothetical protein A1O3_02884 [Capronia epimyces CBS 606.96]|uniref:Uncharacterized protein n=1 Tax=Capronia epimyces CBS 606.96 TaxID=1182542 RepID=W9YAE0_9EURO|nr:uncharacterized protein A1O3_02884 [Capronia epimyces CBS 606.96]EXJ89817.1 hypothetical protein A1O3_02884 [Capronia epimyces CBS 606.96]
MQLRNILTLATVFVSDALGASCPCGWRLGEDGGAGVYTYTHRLHEDFSKYPDIKFILTDPKAADFNKNWMIYDY